MLFQILSPILFVTGALFAFIIIALIVRAARWGIEQLYLLCKEAWQNFRVFIRR